MKTEAIIHERHGVPLYLDEITIPEPAPCEVIIQLYASGVCASQLINLNNNNKNPELLGHEGTGIVIQAGSEVKHVQEGDQVLISWMPHGANEKTDPLQWTSIEWKGNPIKTSIFTWAKHTIMHSQFVTKMEKGFEKYTTSIVGCAGISGYGTVMNVVDIQPNQSVAVFGVGGLGVLAVNAAKALKANPIIAVDIFNEKLEFSKQFGATHTVFSKEEDPVEVIRKITQGGADFVFDMVGIPELREQTILATKEGIPGYSEGGTTVLVGFPRVASEFNPSSILMGQRTYKGSRGGYCIPERDFPRFYQAYQNGDLLLDQSVTKRIKLEEIIETMKELSDGKILGRAIIKIS